MKKIILLFCIFTIIGCKENKSEERIPVEPDNGIGDGAGPPPALSFSENIEEAHNKPAFRNHEAVSFDIILKFGGSERLNAKISMTTNSTGVRVDKVNGTSLIYDGEKTLITPDTAKTDGARFDIFTWQYFFAMPFKLTDPGTVWDKEKTRKLDSLQYNTAKLSFESGTGDSPDDWYIIYQDPETERLKAAAYIVTFSKEKTKAEENPHAIVYSDYIMVEDVAFATNWSFYSWSEEDGLDQKLGEAEISNITFFKPESGYFQAPENSKPINK
ncbi:hypothetical protein NE848_01870 [Gramella jeungdoensis]|uniref:Heat-shock protein Hsp90 n=1 Tax=Gramella jeungdoensis TaxID=708091 RepID=A0ABT0YXP6_9FLAO|nr:DUF6503 family protein [Gramella jeungdoensis]MCM8568104.1 hypothetical protein [Gramella jeungdoensis]